jgi:hypothetical protein
MNQRQQLRQDLDKLQGPPDGPCEHGDAPVLLRYRRGEPQPPIPPGTPRCPRCGEALVLYLEEVVVSTREEARAVMAEMGQA